MPDKNNVWLDDVSKMAEGAFTTMSGVRQAVEDSVRQQVEQWVKRMDLVTRDEHEAVKKIAQDALARVEVLEKELKNKADADQ